MSKVLALIAAAILFLSLGTTFVALWVPSLVDFDQALRLSSLLFSWEVILGAFATSTTVAFAPEIKSLLKRLP